MASWIVPAVVVGVAVVLYIWYATLISRRNAAQEALASIDAQLRKRYDLVPNVLRLAQRFMEHERDLLDSLTELRSKAQAGYDPKDPDQVKEHLEASRGLQAGMARLFAVAEEYPDLRSSDTIVEAQQTYAEVEEHIAAARRFYNSAVASLNNAAQIFPGSVIANFAGVRPMPYYEAEESVREPINADDYLKAK
ncbi:MAG: LemA family protein [Rhodovibrionaceae bacterium]|nr:LemA family protein [Rhodovibrionaceae bacterium]